MEDSDRESSSKLGSVSQAILAGLRELNPHTLANSASNAYSLHELRTLWQGSMFLLRQRLPTKDVVRHT